MVPHKIKDTVKLILIIIAIFLISYIINYICSTIFTQKQAELLNNIQDTTEATTNTEKLNETIEQINMGDNETNQLTKEKVIEKNE